MPTHVLVPFDGSPLSEEAVRYACTEFGDRTVTVLYVIDKGTDETAAIGWGDHPGEWEEWLEDRRDHARELFSTAQAVADEYDVTLQTGVAVGPVARMTVEAAEAYGADLVVVGTHGRPLLEEFLLGSAAETLVRRSPIPVTTIRTRVED
ncbi:universal stress protein [Salinigranum halophilum]|jgi:nucleotide-binding universal stress UspA family protein|uniref:universal stress protein n=1 Tax=Salinigranum halophilum TaxID=2565931 RepID=UPI0010A8FCE4|nr:universal stress protein [Salinigranum halophilum]